MAQALGAELIQKLQNPLIFQWGTPGALEGYTPTIYGTVKGYMFSHE